MHINILVLIILFMILFTILLCPVEIGKDLAISHAPPKIKCTDVQCSIAILLFIYGMSSGIGRHK